MTSKQVRRTVFKGAPLCQDQIIMDYAPLVGFIAKDIKKRLPDSVDVADLISVGMLGLIDAIEKFDPTRDNKFKTYATWRIRGEIFDELRKQDPLSRSMREGLKKLERCQLQLERSTGSSVTNEELANEMKLSLEQLDNIRLSAAFARSSSALEGFDVINGISGETDSLLGLERKEQTFKLQTLIEKLSQKERLVLSLYYYEDLNLSEIAGILKVSESRICQVHRQAITALKKLAQKLSDQDE